MVFQAIEENSTQSLAWVILYMIQRLILKLLFDGLSVL